MIRRTLLAGLAAALAVAGSAPLPARAQAARPNGEALFRQRCQTCHTVTPGKVSPLGPNLRGVVGRKAASGPVPFRYSAALRKSGLAWTRPNLSTFLAAPARMVPGTRMVVALPDPAQRGAIIEYLARAK